MRNALLALPLVLVIGLSGCSNQSDLQVAKAKADAAEAKAELAQLKADYHIPQNPASTNKQDRVKEIQIQAAHLRQRLKALEVELTRLSDLKPVDASAWEQYAGPGPPKKNRNDRYTLRVGDLGHFGEFHYHVESIIDGSTARLSLANGEIHFIVKGASTQGFADHSVAQMQGVWQVTGTEMHSGSTLYVVTGRAGQRLVRPQ